jgi:hypothetical protein
MDVIDFYVFFNELIPDTIDYFASVVKDATQRKKVVGAFYGFMFEFGGSPDYGHNATSRFIDSENLDFMMVTASYFDRQLGSGADCLRGPAQSLALHNKLWYHDNDTVSYLFEEVMRRRGMPESELQAAVDLLGAITTPEGTKALYARSAGFALGNGFFESMFDLHGGYYHNPNLLAEVKRLYDIFEKSKKYEKTSVSEILVVTDEKSCAYVGFPEKYSPYFFSHMLLLQTFVDARDSFYKIGAPFDCILVDDIALADMDQYKLVIFLNCYHLTNAQRQLIENKVKSGGKTAMWIYAAGLFNGNHESYKDMQLLTGMKIVPGENTKKIGPQIKLVKDSAGFVNKLIDGGFDIIGPDDGSDSHFPGWNYPSCRLMRVEDDSAITLGTMPGTVHTTLALKEADDHTSLYAITAVLPPEFYRAIASMSGVHIYNAANDAVYASKSYISVTSNEAGPRTIRFPFRCDIYDPATDELLSQNVTEFKREFQAGETLIIRYSEH